MGQLSPSSPADPQLSMPPKGRGGSGASLPMTHAGDTVHVTLLILVEVKNTPPICPGIEMPERSRTQGLIRRRARPCPRLSGKAAWVSAHHPSSKSLSPDWHWLCPRAGGLVLKGSGVGNKPRMSDSGFCLRSPSCGLHAALWDWTCLFWSLSLTPWG